MPNIRLKLLLPFTLLVISLTECKKPEEKTDDAVEFNFEIESKAVVKDMDLKLFTDFDFPNQYETRIEVLLYYFSDIYLHKENGDSVKVSDVLLNNPDAVEKNLQTEDVNTTFKFSLPEGKYTAFSFGLGVNSEKNGTNNPQNDIGSYNFSHPLGIKWNTYWSWAEGYRFIMIEGRAKSDPDTSIMPAFTYHTGFDQFYSYINLPLSIELNNKVKKTIVLKYDLDVVMNYPGNEIDFKTDLVTHTTLSNPKQVSITRRITENSKKAFTIIQ